MLSSPRVGEGTAQHVPADEEDCCPAYGFRERQWSACSTMVPDSPPMSRMVSPRIDFGEWREEIGGDRFEFEFSGFPDEVTSEVSEVVLPTIKVAQAAASTRKSGASLARRMIFLPTLFGLVSLGLLHSVSFRMLMGVVAVFMILPGLYLYAVDGCRPADYKEKDSAAPQKNGTQQLVLVCLALGSMYAMGISTVLRAFMGAVAALMFLPGLYLYFVEGCRPEDFEEGDLSQKKFGTFFLPLVSFGLGLYGLCVSTTFRFFMGAVAALMLLPGLYLYVVDGCRPEDYEEQTDDSQKKGHTIELFVVALGLGCFSGVCLSTFFWVFMVAVATVMLLPGLYLYVVEGCRPEDYDEQAGGSQKKGHAFALFVVGSMGFCYFSSVYLSSFVWVFMGALATLMLLPGLYLYVVDGCRPEDYTEEDEASLTKLDTTILFIMSLALGSIYALGLYSAVCLFMGVVAAAMLIPGLDLYVVDGWRPEDYTEEENATEKNWILTISFGIVAFYGMHISMLFRIFMGVVAALMLLPGLYLYVVDDCRPEDFEKEEFSSERQAGASLLFFATLGLSSCYGLGMSTGFRVLMGAVAAILLLPGVYLYAVEGCRPEDFEAEVDASRNAFLPWLLSLSLVAFSGVGFSTCCYALMSAVAALMILPGLYLYVVDGCRPEDVEDEENVNENGGASCLFLTSLGIFCYGMFTSTVFSALMVALLISMFLPGMYLYMVDGCRPDDCTENLDLKED